MRRWRIAQHRLKLMPERLLFCVAGFRIFRMKTKNKSAASRYAYALHLIDGDSTYPDDNWLQRTAELPLRGF